MSNGAMSYSMEILASNSLGVPVRVITWSSHEAESPGGLVGAMLDIVSMMTTMRLSSEDCGVKSVENVCVREAL